MTFKPFNRQTTFPMSCARHGSLPPLLDPYPRLKHSLIKMPVRPCEQRGIGCAASALGMNRA
eukprot:6262918-Pyramimonas_sp.AAC.1